VDDAAKLSTRLTGQKQSWLNV